MQIDLLAYLNADATVSSLAQSASWGERPQGGSLPALVLQTISSLPSYGMDGDNDLDRDRVQIDCYGKTYASARGLADAVDDALKSHRGTTGSTSFRGVWKAGERDERIAGASDGGDTDRVFQVSLDYIVVHKSA